MAVDYQLITPLSAITLVLERAAGEQLDQLPALRVVPQMLAAGWGGTASVGAARAAPSSRSAAIPMPACAPPPVVCESPDYDLLDLGSQGLHEDAFAFEPAPSARPGQAADSYITGKFRRVTAKVAGLFAADRNQGVDAAAPAHSRLPVDPLRTSVIELLCECFRARPQLVRMLKEGTLGFTALDVSVAPALLNWLDARAEQHGLDLESGEFWRLLIDELGADPAGSALREACSAS